MERVVLFRDVSVFGVVTIIGMVKRSARTVGIEVAVLLRSLRMILHGRVMLRAIDVAIRHMSAVWSTVHKSRWKMFNTRSIRSMNLTVSMHRPKSTIRSHSLMMSFIHVLSWWHSPGIVMTSRTTSIPTDSQSDLCHDAFVPGPRLDGTDQWHDFLDQLGSLFSLCVVQCCLYDVIGETVIDHVGHSTRPDHLGDQKVSIRRVRHADALLSEMSKTKGIPSR